MITRPFAATALLATLLTATNVSAENAGPPVDDTPILASGQGVTITRQDLVHELQLLSEDRREEVLADPELANSLIEGMYFRARMALLAEEYGYTDEPIVQAQLQRLRERYFRQLIPQRYVAGMEIPDLTDAVEQYYEENADQFMQTEQVHAAHILLRAPSDERKERRRAEAEGLLQQLEDGADFAKLAEKHGEDGTSEIGGDLGFFSRERMVDEFSDAVFALQEPGDVALVETRFGFHLVELRDRRGGVPRPLDEVRESIRQHLLSEYIEAELASYLASVASPRNAEIDTDAVIATVRESAADLEDTGTPAIQGVEDEGMRMPSIPDKP